MVDHELTGAGKAGVAGACVVCCAGPMLVVAGVVSLASLVSGGIAVGSVVLVGLSVWALRRHRLGQPRPSMWRAVAAGGVVMAVGGLVWTTSASRSLVSAGVALLACAAVLSLAAAPEPGSGHAAPRATRTLKSSPTPRTKRR